MRRLLSVVLVAAMVMATLAFAPASASALNVARPVGAGGPDGSGALGAFGEDGIGAPDSDGANGAGGADSAEPDPVTEDVASDPVADDAVSDEDGNASELVAKDAAPDSMTDHAAPDEDGVEPDPAADDAASGESGAEPAPTTDSAASDEDGAAPDLAADGAASDPAADGALLEAADGPAPELGGAVTLAISGGGHQVPRSGDTLVADISGLVPSPAGGAVGTIYYSWRAAGDAGDAADTVLHYGEAAPGESGEYPPIAYHVAVGDIGSRIYAEVSVAPEYAAGAVRSQATDAVVPGSALQGTPTISLATGQTSPRVGDTLTANIDSLYTVPSGDFGEITYYWRVTGGNVTSGAQALGEDENGVYGPLPIEYVVQAADVGKKIRVSIVAQYATGEVYSAETANAAVKQPAPAKPSPPAAVPAGTSSTRVTLAATEGHEYAMATQLGVEPAAWQDSPVFAGLSGGTGYFFARVKETPERYASPRSDAAEISVASSGTRAIDLGAGPPDGDTSGEGWAYASETKTYTVEGGADVLIVGSVADGRHFAVASGQEATISLQDATIEGLEPGQSAISLGEGAAATLFLSGASALTGGAGAPAVDASAAGAVLRLGGSGALSAKRGGGNSDAPGFAGDAVILGGSLNIEGGSAAFAAQPKNESGEAVYMNTLTLLTSIAGHQAGGLYPGAAVTGVGDALAGYAVMGAAADAAGRLYLWLPESSASASLTLQLNNVAANHSASYARPAGDMGGMGGIVAEIASSLVGYAKNGPDNGGIYPANYSFNGVTHSVSGASPEVRIEHRPGGKSPTEEIISAAGGARVTIRDVKINSPAGGAFASASASNWLTLEGANELITTSASEAVGYALTVDGDGSLLAQAPNNSGQAAMGRNWGNGGCNIVINSGNISVLGGKGGYGGGLGIGT
jgi:hypothetical protein